MVRGGWLGECSMNRCGGQSSVNCGSSCRLVIKLVCQGN